MKILIIEDDLSLQEILQRYLQNQRFVVELAANYAEALPKIADYNYACILLDIMLPDGNGLHLLEELQKMNKNDNIIIISAKDAVEDKVTGLELGADDYLTKPFDLSELHARVKSVIRRKTANGQLFVSVGNVRIQPDKFEVIVGNQSLELLRKEYDVLYYFMQRPGYLVSKTTMAEAVWGDHIDQVDNFDFIYAQMKNLRRKLKQAGADIGIKSVYGMGYKLIPTER